ncbi:PTS system mannose/fructose/N-acetylgalactosamine-transporter subunit IIB [Clostridium sp. Cult3]|uniref:PTS system mannose/fructose/N-acetylgalactosamine-transporter subunit IIB n=1 Tax=Clostridium sp. Cult3 TaxID=2079004 RepID=UPI001F219E31|nr:PTS sugar transporter subunit IIB [Clostridium sp. Cult3]MCF6460419.1 PTS mannose/fructose/sorbose transporter subunit IIB [Clostridium sp. Cult3]
MKEVVLTRIDDRLIHGQVITAWVRVTKANRILIVDNDVAADPFLTKVLKMASPPGMEVKILDVYNAIEYLKEDNDVKEKIVLLVKTPDTVYKLQEGGVSLKEVNLGGMGARVGRKKLYKNISISDEEREILKKIIESGTKVYIKIVPDDKEIIVEDLL